MPDGDSLFCHDRVKHDSMLGSGLAKIIQHDYPLHLALGVVFTGQLVESKTGLKQNNSSIQVKTNKMSSKNSVMFSDAGSKDDLAMRTSSIFV